MNAENVRIPLGVFCVIHEVAGSGKTSLMEVFHEKGPEVIWAADYTVELGPGGGDQGGRILFEGRPEEMLLSEASITGKYLRERM